MCFKCGQKGHIARMCSNKPKPNLNALTNSTNDLEQVSVVEPSLVSGIREKLLRVEGKVCGKDALILIDSGASKDFINEQFMEKYQLTIERKNQEKSTVELADGTPCMSSGYVLNVMIQMYP